MGYLLDTGFLIRTEIIIPEADVLLMDSNQPYTLINTNNNFYCLPIAIYVTALNNTILYSGFNHLHCTNVNSYTSGSICATLQEAASPIGSFTYAALLVNFQASPNRFGGHNLFKPLEMFWDTLPTAGDGDLKVIVYYIKEKR